MLMVNLLQWWFTRGFGIFARRLAEILSSIIDFFSIDQLFRTLFTPFRQISAGHSNTASVEVKFRMFLDRLFARIFGAVIRLFLIIIGLACLCVGAVVSLALLIAWPLIPFAIIGAVVLFITGGLHV